MYSLISLFLFVYFLVENDHLASPSDDAPKAYVHSQHKAAMFQQGSNHAKVCALFKPSFSLLYI